MSKKRIKLKIGSGKFKETEDNHPGKQGAAARQNNQHQNPGKM